MYIYILIISIYYIYIYINLVSLFLPSFIPWFLLALMALITINHPYIWLGSLFGLLWIPSFSIIKTLGGFNGGSTKAFGRLLLLHALFRGASGMSDMAQLSRGLPDNGFYTPTASKCPGLDRAKMIKHGILWVPHFQTNPFEWFIKPLQWIGGMNVHLPANFS